MTERTAIKRFSKPFSIKNSSAFSSDDACFTSYTTYYSEGGLF